MESGMNGRHRDNDGEISRKHGNSESFEQHGGKLVAPTPSAALLMEKPVPWHRSPMTFQSIFIIIFEHLGLGVDDFSALRNWDVKA
jgi:hypothetical protein